MTHDVCVLLCMTVCGAALSMLFDLRRSVQRAVKLPDFAVIAADLLFWLVVSAVVIASIWVLNSGILRAYEFIGLILGSVLYFALLSPAVIWLFTHITENILKIITFIFKILLTPIRFLYKIILVYIFGNRTENKEEPESNERIERNSS
ncbi:MAG: spore cortex biosynthesis protein YabQ [Oscillospiraceae bacterium]|nr:spore cortex biosynthesis protein YabQ [Oscillospiraceae bacterium]